MRLVILIGQRYCCMKRFSNDSNNHCNANTGCWNWNFHISKKFKMKTALLVLALTAICSVNAQTVHIIEAGGGGFGNPVEPYYSPSNLTIELGDIVRWENVQGSHNVYAELDEFPSNPYGFSSGQPANAPWTFEETFTEVGIFGFHCTQGDHAATQFGAIEVVLVDDVVEFEDLGVKLYPVPLGDRLYLESKAELSGLEIRDINGRSVLKEDFSTQMAIQTIETHGLNVGVYFILIHSNRGAVIRKFIKN